MNRKIVFLLSFCIIWAVSIGHGSPESPASRQKIEPTVALTKTQGTDQLPKRRPSSAAKGTNTPDTIKLAANRLMTLNFINVDIQEALSALAMQREINIITAPIVSGEISVHLYDVTLDEALNAICLAGGYSFHRRGDLYYVSKPEEGEDPEVEKLQHRQNRQRH